MDANYSSMISSSTTTTASLVMRGVVLAVLVVLFQWFVARSPNVQKETKRRFQHALTGHALVQISYVLPQSLSLVLLVLGAAGMFVAKTFFFDHFLKAFGGLLRPKELNGEVLPGAFYFLIGTAVAISGLVTINLEIARYSVECLALADPMASWVGTTVKSPKFSIGARTSSLSGCLACFGTAMCVGWWMLVYSSSPGNDNDNNNDNTQFTFMLPTLVAGALACTIAEGLPFGNDNLNIPVITAFVVDRLATTRR